MRVLRIGWRSAALVAYMLAGILVQLLVLPLVGRARRDAFTRGWSRGCLALAGVALEARGPDGAPADPRALDGALLLANHVSWLDIVVLNAFRPSHFVAKSEIRAWPLVGILARRSGTIFIERGRRHAVHSVIKTMVAELGAGRVCTVFPEGTTSDGSTLLPFHANLVEAAREAPAPVLPVALRYLDGGVPTTRASYVGGATLVGSALRVLGAPGLCVRIDFAEALLPPHAGTRHVLAEHARERIAQALAQNGAQ